MDLRERQIKDKTPDTCLWLLEYTSYQEWLLRRGLLCITGKPGSGKSTILKFAIDETNRFLQRREENTITASFFFDSSGTPIQKTASGFYRSLLYQLYKQKKDLLHNFFSSIKSSKFGGTGPISQNLRKVDLRSQLSKVILDILDCSTLNLYIDALDECADDEIDEVRQFILDIYYESKAKLHLLGICFSCRTYPVVIEKSDYMVCVDTNNSGDIKRCIRYYLDFTSMREVHKQRVEEQLTNRAAGIFQWIDLVLPRVIEMNRNGRGIKQMLNEIAKTPQDLDLWCMETLEAIDTEDLPSSWSLLRWICFAERPLSLDELRFATVIRPQLPHKSIQEYMENEDICEDADQMERRMRTLTKGLVEAKSIKGQGDHRVAQFIHPAVNDFMRRIGLDALYRRLTRTNPEMVDRVGHVHHDLAKSCLQYLLMEEVLSRVTNRLRGDTIDPEPLFCNYVFRYWREHTEKSDKIGLWEEGILELTVAMKALRDGRKDNSPGLDLALSIELGLENLLEVRKTISDGVEPGELWLHGRNVVYLVLFDIL